MKRVMAHTRQQELGKRCQVKKKIACLQCPEETCQVSRLFPIIAISPLPKTVLPPCHGLFSAAAGNWTPPELLAGRFWSALWKEKGGDGKAKAEQEVWGQEGRREKKRVEIKKKKEFQVERKHTWGQQSGQPWGFWGSCQQEDNQKGWKRRDGISG